MKTLVVTADPSCAPALLSLAPGEATLVGVGWRPPAPALSLDAPGGLPERAAAALIALVAEQRPDLVLGGPGPADRVLLGAVAGARSATILPRVTALTAETVTWRPYGGLVEATARRHGLLLGCADAALTPAASGDLATARRVVGVGQGLRSVDDLQLVRELADVLGAELACTRPLVTRGWLPRAHYVGSSGRRIAPELYVAIGISGQVQHLRGIHESGTIVAINTDAAAPIMAACDHAIVGDLYQVIPDLIRALRS